MKNSTLKILTIFLIILTTIFACTFFNRLTMDYNSEGSYFDKNSAVVYYEQALFIYGIIAFVFFCLTLFAIWKLKIHST